MSPSDRMSRVLQARPRTPAGRPPSTLTLTDGGTLVPRSFTLNEQRLAVRLGVPLRDVSAVPVCHGFRNCCTCPACKNLERQINAHRSAGREPFDSEGKVKEPPAKRQPWEQRAA